MAFSHRRPAAPLGLWLLLLACPAATLHAQAAMDSDHDGLSDSFEGALLQRFQPAFQVAANDCSQQPARFLPGQPNPTVTAQDGTVYGQVFPRAVPGEIEVHYYHLWATDCGRMGHSLDTEHVSALLRGSGTDATQWTAVYWYAAAHEDTVCDASQVTRASTLHAETRGPTVWVSNGKHASFFAETLCRHGCGGDHCDRMEALTPGTVENLGEVPAPANGSVFIASPRWPLAQKMARSDFRPAMLVRLEALPPTDIAWAEPAKRPQEAAILGANHGIDGALAGTGAGSHGAATGLQATATALSVTNDKTGNALERSYRSVRGALGTTARKTGHALHPNKDAQTAPRRP